MIWPFDSDDDARLQVERRLQHPVDSERWRYLVDELEGIKRAREEVEHDAQSIDEALDSLIERYRKIPGAARPRAAPSGTIEHVVSAPDQRLEVLSRLVAEEVARDPWVVRFRREHLSAGLLREYLPDVLAWIREHAELEGLQILSPRTPSEASRVDPPAQSWHTIPATNVWTGPWDDLWCAPPRREIDWSDARLIVVPAIGAKTAEGGVLEELRSESARLAEDAGWSHPVAVWFVLTGGLPLIQRAVGQLRWKSYAGIEVSRMQLDVHPATPPAEVTRQYRHLQARWLRAVQPRRSRADTKRPLGILVEFVRARPDRTWGQRFAEWNEQHVDHRYTHASNMQRDYAKAMSLANPNGRNGDR